MTVQTDFEKAKRIIKHKKNLDEISIGKSIECPWNRDHFESLPEHDRKGIELKAGGRLVISTSIIKDMIHNVAVSIKNLIDGILQKIDISTLDAIIMVGGFSNSPIVLEEMKRLVNKRVPLIVPGDAELSIVMGAVLFGWKKNVISNRMSRMTYSYRVENSGIEGYPDDWVEIVKQGQIARHFQPPISPLKDSDQVITLLAEDENGKELGQFRIPRRTESGGKLISDIDFSGTEIHVDVFAETSQERQTHYFDFLYATPDRE